MKYLTPGPVQLPEFVVNAMAKQPPFHRTGEFRDLYREVHSKLSSLYEGATPIVLPGTGTLAVDVMVYNYVNPGERVLVLIYGEFGRRMSASLKTRGAEVVELEGDRPQPPDVVEDLIRKDREIKALAVVHNETSMGIANRYMDKLIDIAKGYGLVLLVDSVSGFPAEPLPKDIDVVATASHKAFLAPPGASIVYVGSDVRAAAPVPPTMDLRKYLKTLEHWETPYTPPINVMYALSASLDYIISMGLSKYNDVHKTRAEYLYNNLSLRPIPPVEHRSVTITAFEVERAGEIIAELAKHGYVIARGMGQRKDSSIRIGVMGDVDLEDLKKVVEVINSYVDRSGKL